MPEFCDPSGVGWTVAIAIRLLSGKPSACSASGPGTNTAPSLDGGSPALFEFPSHSPAASEPRLSSMARRSFRSSNPEGWQRVAGGHSAAETPGKGAVVHGILEGCQNSATPPGSAGQLRLRSGYYLASLRLARQAAQGRTRRLHWTAGVQLCLNSRPTVPPPVSHTVRLWRDLHSDRPTRRVGRK